MTFYCKVAFNLLVLQLLQIQILTLKSQQRYWLWIIKLHMTMYMHVQRNFYASYSYCNITCYSALYNMYCAAGMFLCDVGWSVSARSGTPLWHQCCYTWTNSDNLDSTMGERISIILSISYNRYYCPDTASIILHISQHKMCYLLHRIIHWKTIIVNSTEFDSFEL